MRSFQQIYVLDLHGSAKKKERAPDGSKDENVFDIEQGVAISIFVKGFGLERGVWKGDLWGRRLEKYKATAENSLKNTDLKLIDPNKPYYLFYHQNKNIWAEYEQGIPIPEIFPVNSVGIATSRDRIAIHFTRRDLLETIKKFSALDIETVRRVYALGRDTQDWKISWAQEDIKESGPNDDCAVTVLYRPFDTRWTYYTGKSRGFLVRPRFTTMRNMLHSDNVGLITSRLTKGENFQHAQVTNHPCEVICMSPKTSNNGFLFPLYLYTDDHSRSENLSSDFRAILDARYEHHYAPEEILGYIYAVLHAPAYRTRYADFLRIDFPRIPFPDQAEDFEALSALGWGLIQAHLLRDLPRRGLAAYRGTGDHAVAAVRYSPEEDAVWINKTQRFEPVPEAVWDFHIGGYRVLDKYLKSRKGRTLSLVEIDHFGAVADALAFTVEQMAEIDAAYRAAFEIGEKSDSAVAPKAH